jgi:hypothetical protein
VGQTPEQVLARLARHADTLRRSPDPVLVDPLHRWVSHAPGAWAAANRFVFCRPRFTDVRMTALGQFLSVLGCAGAVLAFVVLGANVASALVVVLLVAGVTAISRHRSLAWWWTLGVLAGGLLGRFS